MDPTKLGRCLREEDDPDLNRRRWIVGLSVAGIAAGQVVSPDPPGGLGGLFDSDRVDASEYAYSRFSSPDGPIMILTYSVTAWLAGAGVPDHAEKSPWLPLAMAAKTLYDAATTLKLAREERQENRAFCSYCQTATLASFSPVVLALPEALKAARHLISRDV